MTNKTIMIGIVAITFVAGYVLIGTMVYAAQPNGEPFQELQTQIDELNTKVTNIEPDPRADIFFDVFFDIEGYSIDSFFDIFTELQANDESQQTQIDSFFDIFTELQATDTQLQLNIDNEAAARQSADSQLQTQVTGVCLPGTSIRQVNSDGSVLCESDDVGTGLIGRLQVIERVDLTPGNLPSGGATTFSFAPCLPGEIVVGGGYRVSPATVNVFSESSAFSEGSFGWFVNAYYESGTTPGSITAIAYCASIIP